MNELKTNTLYILSGVPSVGKSTFIENLKTNFELPNNCILSTDELRKQFIGTNNSLDEFGVYESISQEANPLIFDVLKRVLNFRMQEGLTTFLDSTALNDEMRKDYVDIARKHNMEVEILIFDRDIEEIKKSNSQRIKRVPEYVIDKMYNDFQKDSIYPHRLLNPFDEFTLETKFLIDENIKLFIVGDIHGLYEDMENLLDKEGFFIENDCIFNKDPNKKLLFVGDIIDRGYDSLKILEIIKNSVENQDHYLILGNHEQKLINSYNKFINNEDTYLFGSSEAVTRTFNEFIKLSKDKQKEYIDFLEKLPHYYVYKNNLVVHANIKHDNIFNLTRQSAIYGTDDALSDIVYSKLKNEYSINKYQLVRGHIPLLDEENINVKNLLTECNKQSIACKKTKYDNNDTEGVISLEEKAVNKGYLCMYNAYSDKMVRQKTNFDYTRDLEIYNGKKLIEDFEKLTKYSLPVYNKNNEITGEKETPLISYKNNPTGTLRIYKYDKKVFFKNLWHLDPLLVKSRGLVLDTNGNIVQHPFTKVFNFNENGSGLDIPNDKEVIAATKENGFLGCITKWNNELLITTTGSFDSDFTNYIKDFITNKQFEHFDHKLYGNLFKFLSNNDLTLMFEVIHPNDPHIIKYEKEEMGLRLIGARGKNINDKELPEEKLDEIGKLINVKRPEWFKIEYGELKDLVKSSQLEGYMVRDIDTQETLLKFKTPYYLTTKFIGRMSIANINFMYSNPNKFKENVDEEYYQLVDLITSKIEKDKFLSYENNSKIEIVRDLINESREDLENTAFNLEK